MTIHQHHQRHQPLLRYIMPTILILICCLWLVLDGVDNDVVAACGWWRRSGMVVQAERSRGQWMMNGMITVVMSCLDEADLP